MAKEAASVSRPTGMFIECPLNAMRRPVFHSQPIAVAIWTGKKRRFFRCPCGTNAFLAPGFTESMGMTEAEARRRGLAVYASAVAPRAS